jgi:uncharacterized protein YndB with AHSA1/START domain
MTMPDILLEVPIAASPDQVYRAITEQQGLASWWTPDVVTGPEVGSTAEFTFTSGPGSRVVAKMEIAALEPGRKVYWTVAEDNIPDWVGTHITWDVTPADQGTNVRFGHRDYPSTEGPFARVGYRWAWYLTSLKDYLETGQGRPGLAFRTRGDRA